MASKKIPARAANDDAAEVVALPADAPKGTDLMDEATTVCNSVMTVAIDCPVMYELAAAELVDLQDALKKLNDKRFSITRPMDAAKAAVMNLFRSPVEMVETKIKAIKAGMLAYDQEQKRKAAIHQRLLDDIAAKQRVAMEAEAAKQAEVARQQHELAQALQASGQTEGISEALDAAEAAQELAVAYAQTTTVVMAAVAATNVPTVEGISTADVWKARVTDLPALLRFIADNPAYHDWIDIKMTGLNDMAKAQRTELRVPGVEAFEESRIAASRTARKAA